MTNSRRLPNNSLEGVTSTTDVAVPTASFTGVVALVGVLRCKVGFMCANDNDSYLQCKGSSARIAYPGLRDDVDEAGREPSLRHESRRRAALSADQPINTTNPLKGVIGLNYDAAGERCGGSLMVTASCSEPSGHGK